MLCPNCGKSLIDPDFVCEECCWVHPGYYIAKVAGPLLTLYTVPREDINMVNAMTNGVSSASMTIYSSETAPENHDGSEFDSGYNSELDGLIPDAVELFLRTHKAKIIDIQRNLKLGFVNAAELLNRMEELGFVEQPDEAGFWSILITNRQWDKMYRFNPNAPNEGSISHHDISTRFVQKYKVDTGLKRFFRR